MTAAPASFRSPEPADAQVVVRVLNGDHQAYAHLVHRYQNAIYRHARGIGLDHDTSLDLVQDSFVKAFDRLEDCRDAAHYRAYSGFHSSDPGRCNSPPAGQMPCCFYRYRTFGQRRMLFYN